jgi:quinol monooxygenase YgiN
MSIGPVEMLSFCAPRRGKAAVMEVFEQLIPAVVDVTSCVTYILLVDGDRAAGLNRITGMPFAAGTDLTWR